MLKARKFLARTSPAIGVILVFVIVLSTQWAAYAGKKKKDQGPPKPPPVIDYSNIVWPNPPAVARIKYQAFFSAEKVSQVQGPKTAKQGWMDRLAGSVPEVDNTKFMFQLAQPYGLATDSKGQIYIADNKVGAVFIFDTKTRDLSMIKNKVDAHFVRILGLAMDDNDRLFVTDAGLHHVLVFNAQHKAEDMITGGLVEPSGVAIDTQNRLLYVADVSLDQVFVFDADSFKLLRRMGTTGKGHELTTPGDFAKPTGVAVDKGGNLYVADTLNDRIEVFDPDGVFVRAWGKNGDGPGYFARPKGVTVDSDGHVWVADGMQDRVQVFTNEGQLCIAMGGHGLLPGQFQGLTNVAADNRHNMIYTAEIYPGRVQQFRYVTDAEAEQQEKDRQEQRVKKATAGRQEVTPIPAPTAPAKDPQHP
jgi:sugar lactone lactonase YvrE